MQLTLKYFRKFKIPVLMVLSLWLVKLNEIAFDFSLQKLGVFPRKLESIYGILFFPLIHADIKHAIVNTVPLLFLGFAINFIFPFAAKYVWAVAYFIPGIFIWIFARTGFHIGASGMVYCLWAFIFFSGIIRRDKRSAALSLLALFLYGSILIGLFPIKSEMSWEGHLSGFLSGLFLSIILRKMDSYKQYDWEQEESEKNLEVSYHKNKNEI